LIQPETFRQQSLTDVAIDMAGNTVTVVKAGKSCCWWRFGAVGSDVGRINEVTLRRARLVLGWVTVSGFNSRCGQFISV